MVGSAIGAVGLVLGASSANKANKAAKNQNAILGSQVDIDRNKWEMYRDQIFPLEVEAKKLGLTAQQYATERGGAELEMFNEFYRPLSESFAQDAMDGIKPQYDRVSREARKTVDQTFDNVEGQQRRNLERRGVKPGSGNYDDGTMDTSLARGATQALGVRQAVDRETDRVEGQNFNRKAIALGRQPLANSPVQGANAAIGASSSGQGLNAAAAGYGNQANMYGDAAAGLGRAVPGLIQSGFDFYNNGGFGGGGGGGTYYPGGSAGSVTFPSGGVGSSVGSPVAGWSSDLSLGSSTPSVAFSEGGPVEGPPGVDQVPARLTKNEYVIPEDVVRRKGTDFFDKLLEEGKQKTRSTTLKRRTS